MTMRVLLVLLLLGCGGSPGQSAGAGGSGSGGAASGGVLGQGGAIQGGAGGILGEGGSAGAAGAPAPTWSPCDPTDPAACGGKGCVFDCAGGARCYSIAKGAEQTPCAFWPCGDVQVTVGTTTTTRSLACPEQTLCVPYGSRVMVVSEWVGNTPMVQLAGTSICLAVCTPSTIGQGGICDSSYFKDCADTIPAGAGYYRPNTGMWNRNPSSPGACPVPARR